MCGIAGIVSPRTLEDTLLSAALQALRHRGPDDAGAFLSTDRTVGLAHARLSVLDLSPAGHQPMSNEKCPKCSRSGACWIVYNGEIYNFQELREELTAKGHRFSSQTDTEVILHLYEEAGEEMVHRLLGMFAFAIYDEARSSIFIVRDRLGIKPLYYAEHAGRFLFGSEIKAILAADSIPREVDWQAVFDYFTFGFVPHPETAFRPIRTLPPAHTLTYDIKKRSARLNRYWTPWDASPSAPLNPAERNDRIRSLLTDAVRSELVSDVPLGVFFSGGIDSTLLAALMARTGSGRVKTFNVGFKGRELRPDEDLVYARAASRALGTDHHELIVDLANADEFQEMLQHFDQPFANPTCYLQYLIAKETRRHVTVALSGVGGDELFGGYPRYRLFPLTTISRMIPAVLGDAARKMLGGVNEAAWDPGLRRLKRFLRGAGRKLPEQYVGWTYSLTETEKKKLLPRLNRDFLPASRIVAETLASLPPGIPEDGRLLYADLQTFLADNLLEYTDKASMAVALEVRVPFLDHRLVELCAHIPLREKTAGGGLKGLLKKIFSNELPAEIRHAPKRGFAPPAVQWINSVFDRYFDDVLTRSTVERENLFSWDEIQSLRRAHRARTHNASPELLAIIMFHAWFKRYIR